MQNLRWATLVAACALLTAGFLTTARAQQPNCLPPVTLPAATQPNIFPGEKEIWLGDAFAEQIQKDYRLIEDPVLTAYLSRIGERLTKNLPLNDLKFRFYLVDLPDANAFVLPGGRIYVSRKLVAIAQSEDELAGVISHELGHLVTHESAVDWTQIFCDVLGVTEIIDRQDLFAKYNQFLDSVALKAGKLKRRNREESGQMAADQAGFYALVTAGYDPAALARFWDRLTETKGKTGSWFSDLFGTTKPEEKRLRDMLKQLNSLPATCRITAAANPSGEFTDWQTKVVGFHGTGRAAALHNVVTQQSLKPALRSDVTNLRFSPDGKYLLAQDDSGINVLTREPLAALFQIPSPDANEAHFTPDSQFLVLSTSNLRVEKWSVAEKKLVSAREIYLLKGCIQTELSPDGRHLACINTNDDLQMIDVATGQPVLQKKEFFHPSFFQLLRILVALEIADSEDGDLGIRLVNTAFSPDGRYFAAGYVGGSRYNIFSQENVGFLADMTAMTAISPNDTIKKMLAGGFAFLGNDRLAGAYSGDVKKSGVVSFPDGKMLNPIPLWRPGMTAATKGDFLLVRPIKNYPLGVMELSTQKIIRASPRTALDIYGDVIVSERRNGELGLYHLTGPETIASVVLPDSHLGRLYVAVVSSDLKWLALSGRSRGGVWDLTTGGSVLGLRAFRGAYFDGADTFYADFPELDETGRNIAKFNLSSRETTPGEKIESDRARQIGQYLVVTRSADKNAKESNSASYERNVILEMRNVKDNSVMWSKPFPKEAPRVLVAPSSGAASLIWDVKSDAAQAVIKADPRLKTQLAAMKEKEGDYFVQIVEAGTGKQLGDLLIETGKGSFRISSVVASGDWVMITDTNNRVLIYSLATGEQKGRVFGGSAAISSASKLLAVENESGKLAIYDLQTMQKRDEYVFPVPIAMGAFADDGKRLFILTANQTAYVIDVTAGSVATAL
jgi:WD40 repeat protein